MVLLLLAAASTITQAASDGDSLPSVLADLFSIIVGAALVLGALGWIIRWLFWRKPIKVRFLIPMKEYRHRSFSGAPDDEETRKKLILGVGEYDVTVQIEAKHDVVLTQIRFVIDGSASDARPIDLGRYPSRFYKHYPADYLDRQRYVDWHGEVKTAQDFDVLPREVLKGQTCHITHRIRTSDDWSGEIAIPVAIRGRFTRCKTYRLQLDVQSGSEDLAFLAATPYVVPTLTVAARSSTALVICLGIANAQPWPITDAWFNFRVPDYVVLAPSDQNGNDRKTEGSLMTAPEILRDESGAPCGDSIKYWERSQIVLAGPHSVMYFRVEAEQQRAIPVRVTPGSPQLLEDIELSDVFYLDGVE